MGLNEIGRPFWRPSEGQRARAERAAANGRPSIVVQLGRERICKSGSERAPPNEVRDWEASARFTCNVRITRASSTFVALLGQSKWLPLARSRSPGANLVRPAGQTSLRWKSENYLRFQTGSQLELLLLALFACCLRALFFFFCFSSSFARAP